jgi:hypothetical protein
VEANSATMIPGGIVYRTSDHSPNGVKPMVAQGPTVNTSEFDIGIIEIEEIRIDSTEKYDQTTQYADNAHCLVHWLKHGDVILANATNPAATIAVGKQWCADTGCIKKPAANAAFDINAHIFATVREAVTGDTIAKVKYMGYGPLDAS